MSDQSITLIPSRDLARIFDKLDRMERQLALLQEKASGGPEWLNRKQAAEMLGKKSPRTVDAYVKAGLLKKYVNPSGAPCYRREDVATLFNQKGAGR